MNAILGGAKLCDVGFLQARGSLPPAGTDHALRQGFDVPVLPANYSIIVFFAAYCENFFVSYSRWFR
jgi:hypothetical protein